MTRLLFVVLIGASAALQCAAIVLEAVADVIEAEG